MFDLVPRLLEICKYIARQLPCRQAWHRSIPQEEKGWRGLSVSRHGKQHQSCSLTSCRHLLFIPSIAGPTSPSKVRAVTPRADAAGADTKTARFFINCLAEEPATVAEFLVPRIRRVPQESRTLGGGIASGSYIRFLTKSKAYGQILARLVTGARKDRFVAEDTG